VPQNPTRFLAGATLPSTLAQAAPLR